MINSIYARMAFPDSCYLGKRVFKKHFYENADLSATDKQAFAEDVDNITWQYSLRPDTISIPPYEDDQREYLEVAILQVDLTSVKRMNRIVEAIHRAIPYPLVAVFMHRTADAGGQHAENCCAVSLAPKRFSQAERGAIVVEEFLTTEWINLDGPTPIQAGFLASLAVTTLPFTHFYAFYSALTDRMIALESARLTGQYCLEAVEERRRVRREALAASHKLELDIAQYKAAIKNETQFNRQVELNTRIKHLEQQRRKLISTL